MPTDDFLAYLTNKKFLPFALMKEEFFDYLRNLSEMVMKSTYRDPGVFDAVATVTGTAIGEVSVAGAFEATDGEGKKFEFQSSDSRLQDVPFENTNVVPYNIGLRSVDMVEELEINPRTGQPEYSKLKENIGTLGTPDTVVDNGSDLTITVDSVTESGVSHAGRTVRVYLVTPLATAWGDSYEDIVVSWSGSENQITTTGLLGQTVGSVSTTVGDYVVVEIGPVLVRVATQDLRFATGVVFLSEFDGDTGSPPTPDMTDQNVLTGSLSDLADITRLDSHSDLKVSVRADASDSGEDQLRAESSGGARVWGVDEAGKHWLPNASVGVPLDDSGHYGELGVPWNSGSFAGSINEIGHTISVAMGPMVLIGLEISGSGSGDVNFTTGSAWIPGTDKESGGTQYFTTPSLSVSDGGGRYIYIHPVNGLQFTTTKATAYASGNLPLYVVEMDSGSILISQDIAYRAGSLHRRGIVTVSSGGVDSPSSNFSDLQAALDFIDEMMDQDSGEWPGVELWILDDMDIGSSSPHIRSNSDGLTIRGVNWLGGSVGRTKVYYTDTNTVDETCFIVEANNVRFIAIHFESQRTGAGTDTSCVRQAYNPHFDLSGVKFEGCRFFSTNTNLGIAIRGDAPNGWLLGHCVDCIFELDGAGPTTVALTEECHDDWRFERCNIIGVDTKTTLAVTSDELNNAIFSHCIVTSLSGTNVSQDVTTTKVVIFFDHCRGHLGDVDNGAFTQCYFESTQFVPGAYDEINIVGGVITGTDIFTQASATSKIRAVGTFFFTLTGATYFVGGANPAGVELIGCQVSSFGDATGVAWITLDDRSVLAHCRIESGQSSSHTGSQLIRVVGTEVRIVSNLIGGEYYTRGVELDTGSGECLVSGNHIEVPNAHSSLGAAGIQVDTDYNRIIGNHLKNIGDGTYGGIGIALAGTGNVINGNSFNDIDGAGIHLFGGAIYTTIGNNVLNNVGLAAVTNPITGAVSDFGIFSDGADRNIFSANNINSAVGDGIELGTGSTFNVCQLNIISNSGGGIDNNGTNNLVGASLSNNNID